MQPTGCSPALPGILIGTSGLSSVDCKVLHTELNPSNEEDETTLLAMMTVCVLSTKLLLGWSKSTLYTYSKPSLDSVSSLTGATSSNTCSVHYNSISVQVGQQFDPSDVHWVLHINMVSVEMKRVFHVQKDSAVHRHQLETLNSEQITWSCHCYLPSVYWSFSWANHHLIRSIGGTYEHH